MSETATEVRTPTVYFIDDSATMREVIKIAFRKENIHLVACPDATSALRQFEEVAPDVVITDVIMPDQDGYQVCQFIKEHERFGRTPVILMSGVVNKTVAEKALSVKADELIRKPFQPSELISRVKNLVYPKPADAPEADQAASEPTQPAARSASTALGSLFHMGPSAGTGPGHSVPPSSAPPAARIPAHPGAAAPTSPERSEGHPRAAALVAPAGELQKLRNEVFRLELLVKRLQAELEAKNQYCAALEAHLKNLQQSE